MSSYYHELLVSAKYNISLGGVPHKITDFIINISNKQGLWLALPAFEQNMQHNNFSNTQIKAFDR